MPLYIGDFLAGTSHLKRDQVGGYLLVLMAAWTRDGKVPDDDAELSQICKCSEQEWKALRPVLAKFFEIKDGFWIQHRLLKEKLLAIHRSEVRQRVGKLGGRPKEKTNSLTNRLSGTKPNDNLTETPSPSPSQSVQSKKINGHEIPPMTRQDFDTMADMRAIPKDCAEWFWNDCESRNWLDRNGNPICKVEPLLKNFATSWSGNQHKFRKPASRLPPQVSKEHAAECRAYDEEIARKLREGGK